MIISVDAVVGSRRGQRSSAAELDTHLKSKGISVRPMAMFGLPNHLRITIGTDDEMAALMEAVEGFFGKLVIHSP